MKAPEGIESNKESSQILPNGTSRASRIGSDDVSWCWSFHEMEMFLHVRELRRYTSCFNSPGDTLVSGARRPATVAQQHGSNNSREDLRKTTLDEDMFCNAADDESRRAQRHKCPASPLFFGRGILLSQSLRVVRHDAPT